VVFVGVVVLVGDVGTCVTGIVGRAGVKDIGTEGTEPVVGLLDVVFGITGVVITGVGGATTGSTPIGEKGFCLP